jgi:hypothetical protein
LRGDGRASVFLDDLLVGFENPIFSDADADGMEDAWEREYGLDPGSNDRVRRSRW